MRYYTVTLRLAGALADAVAVEWTNQPAPLDSGRGWEPCLRQPDGTWRFASHDPLGADQPHRRGPGRFAGLAIRCRLSAAGPWSAASLSRKEIVILEMDDAGDPLPLPPLLVAVPALAGAGRIGAEVTASPGLWSGYPAPEFAFQWRRDGTAIPGAVARAYVPVAADDLRELDCAVTARNATGAVVAVSAALRVRYPAPSVAGALPEEVFDEGPGSQRVETAFAFAGANLTFAAAGARATIDARTGVLTVPTDRPVSGARVTITATNSGGAATAELLYTVEAAEPIDDAARAWRPLYARPQSAFGVAPDHPEYYPLGKYFGEGYQIAHCFEREGDLVIYGGDVAGFRLSPDGGKRWYWPRSNGLHAAIFTGVAADPNNPQILFAAVSAENFVAGFANAGEFGLFRSVDGGQTFAKVLDTDIGHARLQHHVSSIVCDRRTATPATRKWRFVEWSGKGGAAHYPKFWRSDAGGAAGTWTRTYAERNFPAALDGEPFMGLRMDPNDAGTLYVATGAGLWRTANDGGSWTQLAPGVLNAAVGALWIDPDDSDVMLVTCAKGGYGNGVYYTTNGGAANGDWTQVLSPTGNDTSVTTLAVGPRDAGGRRTIYVSNDQKDASHKSMWIQHWLTTGAPATAKHGALGAGAAAPNGQWFRPRIHMVSDDQLPWSQLCGGSQSKTCPHPTNVNRVAHFGYNLPWTSDNRGADWTPAHAGYGGMNGQTLCFDPSDPSRMVNGINDVACIMSEDLPDSMVFARLTKEQKADLLGSSGGSVVSGSGCAIVPDQPEVPAARRGRIILSIGDYGASQSMYTRDRGATAWVNRTTTTGGAPAVSPMPDVYLSLDDGNVVISGAHRSLDAGQTWDVGLFGPRIACGISMQNADIGFALSGGNVIQRCANLTAGSPSWYPWLSTGVGKRDAGEGKVWFWLSPHDDAKAITLHTNGDLGLFQGASTGTLAFNLEISEQYATRKLPIRYSEVRWCTLEPRRLYVFIKSFGRAQVFRGLFNAGYTAIAWEDITLNLPRTANTRGMAIHASGDVFTSSAGGIWCLPAPGALRGDGVWSRMPRAFPQDGSY